MMPRMSSSRMIRYDSFSIFISVPPYFEISTLSPFLTVKSTFLPLSSIFPVPRATTLPSCGFSFAVSGMMIPPFFTSFSSIGCTSTRSPSGFTLTVAIGVVFNLDGFLRLLVLFSVRFGFALHLLDFLFRKSRAAGDGNLLFLAGTEVLRRDVQDAVRVDVEGHFDLRNAARRRRDSIEVERAKILVIARKRAFALQHFDFDPRLIVAVSRKDLRLAGRDSGVARNHRCSHTARGLNRE